MPLDRKYAVLAADKAIELLNLDSPTGYTFRATEWIKTEFEALGFKTTVTNKGAVLVDFCGNESQEGGLLLEAHADTLGAIVAEIKGNGRLRVSKVGGLNANNVETENVAIYTRDGRKYEGTFQLCNPSIHVNDKFSSTERNFDTVEVVIDERVSSAYDVRELGIEVGDFVCPNPRAHITPSGYIKSRFLDDKLSVGIILGFARFLKDENVVLPRRTYALFTTYEEVGHGGAVAVPAGVTEAISVDMGCVGNGLRCTEHECSICVKDSGGPYDYNVTSKLIAGAKKEGAAYVTDVYPFYGSDVESTLSAGNDVRHGLIGAGVYASHGYERSHIDGVFATIKTLKGYLGV